MSKIRSYEGFWAFHTWTGSGVLTSLVGAQQRLGYQEPLHRILPAMRNGLAPKWTSTGKAFRFYHIAHLLEHQQVCGFDSKGAAQLRSLNAMSVNFEWGHRPNALKQMSDIVIVQLALETHVFVISKWISQRVFYGIAADSSTSSIWVGGPRHHLS